MKKRLIAVICVVAVVLGALATILIVNATRDRRAPELDTVRARFELLIEASGKVNEILFGAGLPTYPRITEERVPFKVDFKDEEYTAYYYTFRDDSIGEIIGYQYYVSVVEEQSDGKKRYVYYDIQTQGVLESGFARYRYAHKTKEQAAGFLYHDEETGYYYYDLPEYKEPDFFYTSKDDADYDYCTKDCGFAATDDIKALASQVYSAEYLAPIYEALFMGVSYSEDNSILTARYRDYVHDGTVSLQKSNTYQGRELADRRYLYDSMRMLDKSTSDFVVIEIESYIAGQEDKKQTIQLAFTLQNGDWFLDSPTY